MRVYPFLAVLLIVGYAMAQSEVGKVIPNITTVPIEEGAVTALHLSAGYTTSVRVPEEISSVVIGNPATFKAEHSEAEPRLVFLKPITTQAVESNVLITTKSGKEISLHLISAGPGQGNVKVDFLLDYRSGHTLLVNSSETHGFLISEASPIAEPRSAGRLFEAQSLDVIGNELERQEAVSAPLWQGKEILVAIGDSKQHENQTLLRFSVLNNSKRVVELLPPQIEFSGGALHKRGKRRIKAEPIAIYEYRMTSRRLAPGERTDGVVAFNRPAFKESNERLQLQLAEAAQVDRPILIPVPFTATNEGDEQ
ncbi:MAG: hypothetical protein ACRD4I_04540 [Candidatus Angelobacter sp.]